MTVSDLQNGDKRTRAKASADADLPLRHAVRILRRAADLERVVMQGGPPLDRSLQKYQRANPNMGRKDRLVLGTAVYSLARNRSLCQAAGPDLEIGTGGLLLLALMDGLSTPGLPGSLPHLPGGVSPWETRLRRLAGLRDEAARVLAAHETAPLSSAPEEALAALQRLYSIPAWWLKQGPWTTVGAASAELSALRRPQHLVLRAQSHTTDRDEVLAELTKLGIPAGPTELSPWGIVVAGRHNVLATSLYRDGRIEVQDEGSQLCALLCDPKPGERVLDLCAGGGGKSLALAANMGGTGMVLAYDVDARRLADTRRRARRSGLHNIRAVEEFRQVLEAGPFDLVLVDAPCSSTGTLRRNPDVAWRWAENDVERLQRTQAELLDRAVDLVRPGGGHLVYATCSLLTTENAAQTESFLGRHPGWEAAPPGDRRAHGPLLAMGTWHRGALRLRADSSGYSGDGFFLARFRNP